MKAPWPFETLVFYHITTWHHNPKHYDKDILLSVPLIIKNANFEVNQINILL